MLQLKSLERESNFMLWSVFCKYTRLWQNIQHTGKENWEQQRSNPESNWIFFFGGGGKAEGKAKEKKTENKSLTGFLLNICLTKHIHEHGKDCLLFHTLIAVKYNNEMTWKFYTGPLKSLWTAKVTFVNMPLKADSLQRLHNVERL